MAEERVQWNTFDSEHYELPLPSDIFIGEWLQATKLVPLRRATKIIRLEVMSLNYLKHLLSQVWLRDFPKTFPYKSCEIEIAHIDPDQCLIGQTYIEMQRYQMLVGGFQNLFSGFAATIGMANHAALLILCEINDKSIGLAYHVPPLIEEHEGHLFLIDGVHRQLTAKLAGTTIASVVIKNVKYPFPCDVHSWDNVRVISERPPYQERFLNAKPEFFRQLKEVGIGG